MKNIWKAKKSKNCLKCDNLFLPLASHSLHCLGCSFSNCVICNKKIKIRFPNKGLICSQRCQRLWQTGRKRSIEFIKKMAFGHLGIKKGKYIKCHYCKNKSYKYPTKLRRKHYWMFCNNNCWIKWSKSSQNPNWLGDAYPENKRLRQSLEARRWAKKVKKRDNYICQICGIKDNKNHADHIKPWALYPDLRFDISNGRTLCLNCHRKSGTWGIRGKLFNSKVNLANASNQGA